MIIRRGDTGAGVAAVQFALNSETSFVPKLKIDGIFGPRTEARVKQQQSQQRLAADGLVGPLTLDTLFGILTMSGRATFRRGGATESASAPFRPSATPFGGSPSPALRWMNPEAAEYLRQQEAFWKWWASGPPKLATLSPNVVVVPTNTPYGPVYLPRAPQVIPLTGPPAKKEEVRVAVEPDRENRYTFSLKGEGAANLGAGKFKEAKYGFGLDYIVLKSRTLEIEAGISVARDHKGDVNGEVEVTFTGGSGLSLKYKVGRFGFKLIPYLAAAVSTDLAIEASGGVKAAAEVDLGKRGIFEFKAGVGLKHYTKFRFGPTELPNGREEHKVDVTGLGASGFIWLGVEW